MKVYDLQVPSNEIFHFYQFENKWIRVNDLEHPKDSLSRIWDPVNKWGKSRYIDSTVIVVPSMCKLRPEHFDDLLDEHILALFEMLDKDQIKTYNLFVVYKHLPDGYIEVGLFARDGHTDVVNEKYTRMIEKRLNMKAFW